MVKRDWEAAPLNDLYTRFVRNLRYSWDWADLFRSRPRPSRNRRNRRLEIQRGWHFTSTNHSVWCTAVPPCHCTAAHGVCVVRRQHCGLMRSKARTESFLIPGLSLVFYMNLMQSKGIWLQFHAGDAMSTKTLDLCIWSKRFLLNIRFCIYLGKHFQLASRCQGNLKLKIFDSSNGENRWGILEDNWNKFWKFVLSTQGAGDPPSPISEVDLFH